MDRETERSEGVLMGKTLAATAVIFALLEIWRPYFFLTDDNLSGGLGFFTEMGQNLLAGKSPFISYWIFGGHYNLLYDPTFFAWHPFFLLASLLAGTPFKYAIIDVLAFVFLLLTSSGFVCLSTYLRREYALRLSDNWILFYALSFTYSVISLVTAASWLTFLGVESAMPWLALGIVHRHRWTSVKIILLFCLSELLGGHLTVLVSSTLLLTVFAAGVSYSRQSWQPLVCWLACYAAALLVITPVFLPMLEGFLSGTRSSALTVADMQSNNIPFEFFPTSLFAGMALWVVDTPQDLLSTYVTSFAACAAAWCFLSALVGKNKTGGLENVTLLILVILALMVCRPTWVSQIMIHLPLLRSMRWPFRELIEFQFFFHLFLVLRRPGFTPVIRRGLAWLGTGLMVIPLVAYSLPPTLSAFPWDRRLILSGDFDRYWDKVRTLIQPGDHIAVVIPEPLFHSNRFEQPYSLLGTYNYAILAREVNVWGWSQTPPPNELYTKFIPYFPFGAYQPYQLPRLLAECPDVKIITLEREHPLKITFRSRTGPVIDLTPLIPVDDRHP